MESQVVMPDLTEVGKLREFPYLPDTPYETNLRNRMTEMENSIRTYAAFLTTGKQSDKTWTVLKDMEWIHSGSLINYSEYEHGGSWMSLWMKTFPKNIEEVSLSENVYTFGNRPHRMGYCCGGVLQERKYWTPLRNPKLMTLVRVPAHNVNKTLEMFAKKAGFRHVLSTPFSEYYCNNIPFSKFKVPA